jgi:hypothetical protein
MFTAAYVFGSCLTAGVIGASNRATGINPLYTIVNSLAFPVWWTRLTLTDSY